MFYPPVVLPLKKIWQLIVAVWRFFGERTQALFDFLMDRLVTWLCRYYQSGLEFR